MTDVEAREEWARLDHATKCEILALATVGHHENTHRVDMLTTPFGAAVAVAGASLYLHLDRNALRVAELNNAQLEKPFLDSAIVPEGMRGQAALLLSLKRRAAHRTTHGWADGTKEVSAWGRSYDTLCLLGQFDTLKTSDKPFNYITAAALLECRGLAHALRRIRWLFAYDAAVAGAEMVRYLRTFYAQQQQWHDYRFLLDQAARGAGYNDTESLLEALGQRAVSGETLEQFITIFSTFCWAALHCADPVVQLCSIMNYVQRESGSSSSTPRWSDPGSMLDEFDEWVVGLSGRGVEALLQESQSLVERALQETDGIYSDRARNHFRRILSTLHFQLQCRIERGTGFRWPMGLTYDGSPFNSSVTVEEFGNVMTMLVGDELATLLEDESKPIIPPDSDTEMIDWYSGIEQMLLYSAANVDERRTWLSRHYGIDDLLCIECLSLIPIRRYPRWQQVRCSNCGSSSEVDLSEVTRIVDD